MQAEPKIWNDYRPLPIGTKLIYYDGERKLNVGAEVKASTVSFLWVVDIEDRHQSFILYEDVTEVLKLGPVT